MRVFAIRNVHPACGELRMRYVSYKAKNGMMEYTPAYSTYEELDWLVLRFALGVV